MMAASISEIKKELQTLDAETTREICIRLARFKNDNKELLTYLLFEAHDEEAYIQTVKDEINEQFKALPTGVNTYFIKKTLRRILRFTNRQIKYSGIRQTEIAIRIFFCAKMKEMKIPMAEGTVLFNIYKQQIKKTTTLLEKLPEDLQGDYEREWQYLVS